MRSTPSYIRTMLRDRDPLLDVEWDEREALWYLTLDGERQFSLEHADGSPVRNLDGHGTELLETVQRCDMRERYGAVRRRLRASRADHERRARCERERMLGEARGEARGVARWIKQGPTAMVGGPIATRSKG